MDSNNTANITLPQDFIFRENLANFVRSSTLPRVVYANGAGAYGTFRVNKDLSEFTKAALFSKAGNSCKVFVRFSELLGKAGSTDTGRDSRGFALKFFTQDGVWDLVGSNMPVFYVRDGEKYPAMVQSQKRDPKTNLHDTTAIWDFWASNPESLHGLLMLMSERGMPKGYRHMNGFGAHTYSFINDKNERFWVKFHFKTVQGIENFNTEEAVIKGAENPDFAQEDLANAIRQGDFPKWTVAVQIMTDEQAQETRWNPFDVTKVWLHDEFPLMEIGELELNKIPEDYFAEVEQAAFSPANIIDGIGFSPDKLLQSRIFAYPDAQRHRLGSARQNPFPDLKNSFGTASAELPTGNFIQQENADDHYTQPGLFYTKALKSDEDRENLAQTIITEMKKIKGDRTHEIIYRQMCYFFRANIELGMKIAAGLNLNIDANLMGHTKEI